MQFSFASLPLCCNSCTQPTAGGSMSRALILTAALLAALPATADEMWQTPFGLVQWEKDIGDVAVFGLVEPDDLGLRVFVPGLPFDVDGGRGVYFGFWTAEDGEFACQAQMVDPTGRTTAFWGQFTLNFVADAFPSDWAGLMGECFSDTYIRVTGRVYP